MDIDQLYTPKLFQFVQDHLQDDPALLLLKHHKATDFDLKEAVQQISARQKAKNKLPTWTAHPKVIFPASLSIEQSSSELTACFKAGKIEGESLIDLTGGFGVDTFFMGQKFDRVVYIERQDKLAKIVSHNFRLLSQYPDRYRFSSTDAINYLEKSPERFDWLYIDPARRGGNNQKLFKLADCDPDVQEHWALLKKKSKNILIKASPMLDIKAVLADLPGLWKVMVVGVKNEVKEILLIWSEQQKETAVEVLAVDLRAAGEQPFEFTFEEEEGSEVTYALPDEFLIEANAVIMKAGGFKVFAERFGLSKLHPNTHLYTTSRFLAEIPGRIFKIVQEVKLDKKEIKRHFPKGQVNVIVRNHPLKADTLKKKYGLKDGGDDFLIAAMTMDGKCRVYWCRKVK